MINPLILTGLLAGLVGIVVAVFIYWWIDRQPLGDENMVRVWSAIREGATAYMRRQMRTIILFSPTISIIVTLSVYAGYSGHISTQFTLRNMITPTLSIILTSLIVGLLFGGPAVGALVIGATASGIVLAITMMWGGAAWDNAKKYIEAGHLGGKGSPAHAAAVIGDTVGDPLKGHGRPITPHSH